MDLGLLQIEWYFNGRVLQTANRIQTYHDFGYVALDIESVRAEDAGTYTVVARNALGEAQLSASMEVESMFSNVLAKIVIFFKGLSSTLTSFVHCSPIRY